MTCPLQVAFSGFLAGFSHLAGFARGQTWCFMVASGWFCLVPLEAEGKASWKWWLPLDGTRQKWARVCTVLVSA